MPESCCQLVSNWSAIWVWSIQTDCVWFVQLSSGLKVCLHCLWEIVEDTKATRVKSDYLVQQNVLDMTSLAASFRSAACVVWYLIIYYVKRNQKKLWFEMKKWQHDRFDEHSQAPKSRDEIVAIYGFDIRTAADGDVLCIHKKNRSSSKKSRQVHYVCNQKKSK